MGNRFLDLAVAIARANKECGHLPRMAAVLTDKYGTVIGLGENRLKTHPLQAKFSRRPGSIYLHAEIDAIVDALKRCRLDDIEEGWLYVARVFKDGTPALARPCLGCQRAIMHFGIQHVEWTDYA